MDGERRGFGEINRSEEKVLKTQPMGCVSFCRRGCTKLAACEREELHRHRHKIRAAWARCPTKFESWVANGGVPGYRYRTGPVCALRQGGSAKPFSIGLARALTECA